MQLNSYLKYLILIVIALLFIQDFEIKNVNTLFFKNTAYIQDSNDIMNLSFNTKIYFVSKGN